MKKIILALSLFLFSSLAFCKEYKVVEVTGLVKCQINNSIVQAEPGLILNEDTYINTGLNSFMKIECNGAIYSIKPMRKGSIKDFCSVDKTNIILGSSLNKEAIGKLKQIASKTSGRASEAKEDLDWEE